MIEPAYSGGTEVFKKRLDVEGKTTFIKTDLFMHFWDSKRRYSILWGPPHPTRQGELRFFQCSSSRVCWKGLEWLQAYIQARGKETWVPMLAYFGRTVRNLLLWKMKTPSISCIPQIMSSWRYWLSLWFTGVFLRAKQNESCLLFRFPCSSVWITELPFLGIAIHWRKNITELWLEIKLSLIWQSHKSRVGNLPEGHLSIY